MMAERKKLEELGKSHINKFITTIRSDPGEKWGKNRLLELRLLALPPGSTFQ
jgi:hypothetical protein